MSKSEGVVRATITMVAFHFCKLHITHTYFTYLLCLVFITYVNIHFSSAAIDDDNNTNNNNN